MHPLMKDNGMGTFKLHEIPPLVAFFRGHYFIFVNAECMDLQYS